MTPELFTIEDEDGVNVRHHGEGGFTVFTSAAEAEDSAEEGDTVIRFSRCVAATPDPVRADPVQKLTDAELKDAIDIHVSLGADLEDKTLRALLELEDRRAVRADPVREELVAALFEAVRVACQCAADTAGTPSYDYFDSLVVKWRSIAASAESTAPAQADPKPEQMLKAAGDLECIAAGLRDVVAGRITPMSKIDPDFAAPAQEKTT